MWGEGGGGEGGGEGGGRGDVHCSNSITPPPLQICVDERNHYCLWPLKIHDKVHPAQHTDTQTHTHRHTHTDTHTHTHTHVLH